MLTVFSKFSNKKLDSISLFNRGVKLSFCIFIFSLIFLISWVIGFSRESVIISNSNIFSKFFFFLNPHLLNKVVFQGNVINFLQGAITLSSFLFLCSYLVCVVCFVIVIVSCAWLFTVAYSTSVKPFHYISCLGIFPVIGFILIFVFVFKLAVYKYEMRVNYSSRYEKYFSPEVFSDSDLELLTTDNWLDRKITDNFTIVHYRKIFIDNKPVGILEKIHSYLGNYLS